MPRPLLIDLSHTCHTAARTGIQRVARGLWLSLKPEAQAVTFDPYQGQWRPLRAWENRKLAETAPAAQRGARWPLAARLRGWLTPRQNDPPWISEAAGLIVPELFSPSVGSALPRLLARVKGPRVALFHDATALRLPEFAPQKTAARLPSYLLALAGFDGIAAISAASRDELLDYWKWVGLSATPPVIALPLGIDPPPLSTTRPPDNLAPLATSAALAPDSLTPLAPSPAASADSLAPFALRPPDSLAPLAASPAPLAPQIVCVGTIEGRKNHLALFAACEELWKEGLAFSLRVVGAGHATGGQAMARMAELRRAGRPIVYEGACDDASLERAYAAAAFTVYPSLAEGFGLPVAESLARGKPCVCSGRGAVGEIAAGGGCVTVDPPDALHLRLAIGGLLRNPAELSALSQVACRRRFATTADHARSLTDWMATLVPKAKVANA